MAVQDPSKDWREMRRWRRVPDSLGVTVGFPEEEMCLTSVAGVVDGGEAGTAFSLVSELD